MSPASIPAHAFLRVWICSRKFIRAAPLYLRVFLNVLAGLFERNELNSMSDDMIRLLIDGLHRTEAIIETRSINCPKVAPANH